MNQYKRLTLNFHNNQAVFRLMYSAEWNAWPGVKDRVTLVMMNKARRHDESPVVNTSHATQGLTS